MAILMLAAVTWMSAPSFAALNEYVGASCHALKLKAASGVPGDKKHHYSFNGHCNIVVIDNSNKVLRTLPAEAEGNWNESTKTFQESFHILAPVHLPGFSIDLGNNSQVNIGPMDISAGAVQSIFKCDDDPLISKAACILTQHSNQSGFEPFSHAALDESRPLLKTLTTLAEASALSKQAASNAPPSQGSNPPPKQNIPQVKSGDQTAGSSPAAKQLPPASPPGPVKLVIEGEDLVKAGKFQVAGGKVGVQPMTGFGTGWSGGAQLLWADGAVGAVLDLVVDIPEPGKYAVELYMTRAPDYANLKLEVDGKASPVPINAFSPQVMPTGPLQAGTFSLQPGKRKLSFMIVGKYAQSKGYLAGLDRIVLSKIGAP